MKDLDDTDRNEDKVNEIDGKRPEYTGDQHQRQERERVDGALGMTT